MPRRYARKGNLLPFRRDHHILMRSSKIGITSNLSGLAGSKTHHNYLISKRSQCFTLISHPVDLITYNGTSWVQAQFPIVIGITCMPRKRNMQIAKRLIGHTTIGFRHYFLSSQCLCFKIFSFEHQLAHFGNIFQRIGISIIIGTSCPNSFFIQLDMLHTGIAEYHRSQPPVTQRKCFSPNLSGFIIPQFIFLCGSLQVRTCP